MTPPANDHVVLFLEEPSAETVLKVLVPKIIPGAGVDFVVYTGKDQLLKKLPDRLRGYREWLPHVSVKLAVVVDRDDDDCAALKRRLDEIAADAGLAGLVLNRVVIEELEAWYFGDVPAIHAAYPRVPTSLAEQAGFRDPDAIRGGTWEALERVLQKYRYHKGGLRKLAAAEDIAPHMDIENNRSKSFQVFRDGLRRLVKEGN